MGRESTSHARHEKVSLAPPLPTISLVQRQGRTSSVTSTRGCKRSIGVVTPAAIVGRETTMHSFYLKLDGFEGDAADSFHRGWLQLASYVITDDPESDPDRHTNHHGCFNFAIDTDNDEFQYLNIKLPITQ